MTEFQDLGQDCWIFVRKALASSRRSFRDALLCAQRPGSLHAQSQKTPVEEEISRMIFIEKLKEIVFWYSDQCDHCMLNTLRDGELAFGRHASWDCHAREWHAKLLLDFGLSQRHCGPSVLHTQDACFPFMTGTSIG